MRRALAALAIVAVLAACGSAPPSRAYMSLTAWWPHGARGGDRCLGWVSCGQVRQLGHGGHHHLVGQRLVVLPVPGSAALVRRGHPRGAVLQEQLLGPPDRMLSAAA